MPNTVSSTLHYLIDPYNKAKVNKYYYPIVLMKKSEENLSNFCKRHKESSGNQEEGQGGTSLNKGSRK